MSEAKIEDLITDAMSYAHQKGVDSVMDSLRQTQIDDPALSAILEAFIVQFSTMNYFGCSYSEVFSGMKR